MHVAHVGAQGDLQASAEAGAVYRGDDRNRDLTPNPSDPLGEIGWGLLRAIQQPLTVVAQREKCLYVEAGAERRALS